ncbi:hypothetical protein NYR55_08070 [Sphingomonas sp. BGYR3]|uniref:hypothetical protein n=1 Tax=Sphingomonas sp. BGYR3 TaxID=2975483 RepID=UPI0021A4D886|nr:hypothetical protein [Sphingomonas sp. BGYR3]MDG5488569.1 hypothetical protein [Sphingomonas sp. BGYR3]
MSWAVLAGSLVAILALAGVARLLGLGIAQPLTGDQACRIAAERVIGFTGDRAFVGDAGRTALVLGQGTAVAIRQHGMGVIVVPLALPLVMTGEPDAIRLDTGDPRIGTMSLPRDPALLTYL